MLYVERETCRGLSRSVVSRLGLVEAYDEPVEAVKVIDFVEVR